MLGGDVAARPVHAAQGAARDMPDNGCYNMLRLAIAVGHRRRDIQQLIARLYESPQESGAERIGARHKALEPRAEELRCGFTAVHLSQHRVAVREPQVGIQVRDLRVDRQARGARHRQLEAAQRLRDKALEQLAHLLALVEPLGDAMLRQRIAYRARKPIGIQPLPAQVVGGARRQDRVPLGRLLRQRHDDHRRGATGAAGIRDKAQAGQARDHVAKQHQIVARGLQCASTCGQRRHRIDGRRRLRAGAQPRAERRERGVVDDQQAEHVRHRGSQSHKYRRVCWDQARIVSDDRRWSTRDRQRADADGRHGLVLGQEHGRRMRRYTGCDISYPIRRRCSTPISRRVPGPCVRHASGTCSARPRAPQTRRRKCWLSAARAAAASYAPWASPSRPAD